MVDLVKCAQHIEIGALAGPETVPVRLAWSTWPKVPKTPASESSRRRALQLEADCAQGTEEFTGDLKARIAWPVNCYYRKTSKCPLQET